MPRALTEHEKCRQCQKLLEKGLAVVMEQGLRKVSVDEITKAAGMAKGTFYHHFTSKEAYLCEVIKFGHEQIYVKAEPLIMNDFNPRDFLKKIFFLPELGFFIKYEREISELMSEHMSADEMEVFNEQEVKMIEGLLLVTGADITRIKPGIVHNYIHALYLIKSSDIMIAEELPETIDLIIESLIAYIYGGTK